MKKMILTAMMIMATMSFTASVSAQDVVDKKAKKECCDKKAEKKAGKDCCEKKAEKAEKAGKDCCDKKQAKAKDCKKCNQCKPDCAEKNCKDCANNHKCDKSCKK